MLGVTPLMKQQQCRGCCAVTGLLLYMCTQEPLEWKPASSQPLARLDAITSCGSHLRLVVTETTDPSSPPCPAAAPGDRLSTHLPADWHCSPCITGHTEAHTRPGNGGTTTANYSVHI